MNISAICQTCIRPPTHPTATTPRLKPRRRRVGRTSSLARGLPLARYLHGRVPKLSGRSPANPIRRSSPAQKMTTTLILIFPSSKRPVPTVRLTLIPLSFVTPGPLGVQQTANPHLQLLARMPIPVKPAVEKTRCKLIKLVEQLSQAKTSSRRVSPTHSSPVSHSRGRCRIRKIFKRPSAIALCATRTRKRQTATATGATTATAVEDALSICVTAIPRLNRSRIHRLPRQLRQLPMQ